MGEGRRRRGASARIGKRGIEGSQEKEFIHELEEASWPGQVEPLEANTCVFSFLERGEHIDHYHILIAFRKGHL